MMQIMLDAGHGYQTPGKRSPDGMREYEFNRAVATEAKKLLQQYEHVHVLYAHSDEQDVPLKTRTDLANRSNVDVYISIHANAFGHGDWTSPSGIETYIYPTKPPIANELANKIQHQLIAATGLRNRGVKTANFHVLRETKMDAVLIECGFMTNQHDQKLLRSEASRKKIASAIVLAIAEQYQLIKKEANPSTAQVFYKVQVGSFKERINAELLAAKLKNAGYDAYVFKQKS